MLSIFYSILTPWKLAIRGIDGISINPSGGSARKPHPSALVGLQGATDKSEKKDTAGCWGFGNRGRLAGGRKSSLGWGSERALPFAHCVTFSLLCTPFSSSVKWAARFPRKEEITWGIKNSLVELYGLNQKDCQDTFQTRGKRA